MKNNLVVISGFYIVMILVSFGSYAIQPCCAEADVTIGVWNNFDFSRTADDWSVAAQEFGGKKAVIDLVVAQATLDGLVRLPFSVEGGNLLYSYSEDDLIEPYLNAFDSQGLKAILSIQPLNADVTQIIELLLSRYGHHDCIIGVNIDIEWKESGESNHVSNIERDSWMNEIRSYDQDYLLFLTYFEDYTHFPDDVEGMVVLFDGEEDTQMNLLEQYGELAKHYDSVGIYTGYYSSVPSTASKERILAAVPNTDFILHTYDVFSNRKILVPILDNVQVDWLESDSVRLLDLHLELGIPVTIGVIPENLNNIAVGGGFLSNHLVDLNNNYFDVFEVAQNGYAFDESEALFNKTTEEQKVIIEKGLDVLKDVGMEPVTYDPPFASLDETTIEVLRELGFKGVIDLFGNLQAENFTVLNSGIILTERVENATVFKSSEQVMAEIDELDADVVFLLYQIHNFQTDSRSKRNQIEDIFSELKASQKYAFMTARQSYELQAFENGSSSSSNETDYPWVLIVPVLAVSTVLLAFFGFRKYRSSKK